VSGSAFLEDGKEYVYQEFGIQNAGTMDYSPSAAGISWRSTVRVQVTRLVIGDRFLKFFCKLTFFTSVFLAWSLLPEPLYCIASAIAYRILIISLECTVIYKAPYCTGMFNLKRLQMTIFAFLILKRTGS
jgi:hypothetical protein